MDVLHVSEVAKGGVATYLDLIAHVARPDDRHHALIPADEASHVAAMPVTGYPVGTGRLGRARAMLRALRLTIRHHRPDLIFLHSSFALAALPVLRVIARDIPVIYCAHGWARSRYAGGVKARMVSAVEGRLPGMAAAVVNISAHDQALAERLGYAGAHHLIENAVIDPGAPSDGAEGEALQLLFVGRDAPQKGLDVLRDAMRHVATARPDIELRVIGDAEPRPDDPATLRCTGWATRDEVAQAVRDADALVVPSRWEGFGLVAVEALAHGTPIWVSDRGALPQLVQPGVTGAVFTLEQNAIAASLMQMDKAQLRAMRPACRAAYLARFTPDRFAGELHALLDDVAAQK